LKFCVLVAARFYKVVSSRKRIPLKLRESKRGKDKVREAKVA